MITKKDYTKQTGVKFSRYDYICEEYSIAIIFSSDVYGKRLYELQITYEGETYKYEYLASKKYTTIRIGMGAHGVPYYEIINTTPFRTAWDILNKIKKVIEYKRSLMKAIKKCQGLLLKYNNGNIPEIMNQIFHDSEVIYYYLQMVHDGAMTIEEFYTFLDEQTEDCNTSFKLK